MGLGRKLSLKSWGSSDSATNSPSRSENGRSSFSPSFSSSSSSPQVENILGLLRVKIIKGVNLAIRDVYGSDPYVVLSMGKQKPSTLVIKNDLNPVWNEDLELSVVDPNVPITLNVFDCDKFTKDDSMGEAEIDVWPFIDALKKNSKNFPSGKVIKKIAPTRQNCLVEESQIVCENGEVVQNMYIRLKNVECGEIELQLRWTDPPDSKGM